MNLLLFSNEDRVGNDRIRLTDHRLQHLRSVIRAQVGDSLRVGEIDGRTGRAELVSLGKREAVLDVMLDSEPPPKLSRILSAALINQRPIRPSSP